MSQIHCKILSFGIIIRESCCFMKVLRLKISLIVDLEGPNWDEEKKESNKIIIILQIYSITLVLFSPGKVHD